MLVEVLKYLERFIKKLYLCRPCNCDSQYNYNFQTGNKPLFLHEMRLARLLKSIYRLEADNKLSQVRSSLNQNKKEEKLRKICFQTKIHKIN